MSERVEFKNSRGLKLVGVLEPAKTDKIVIMAHGFTSNKDRPKFVKTTEKLCAAGFAVLRFDFTGSGESDKEVITVASQVDDLKSMINFAREKGYSKIGLLGSSLGGIDCILAYDKDIKAIVLLAPLTAAKTPDELKDPKNRQKLLQEGYFIVTNRDKEFRIEKEYLQERESIKQEQILSVIKCPVLIIHGDKDDVVPLEHSKNAMKYLPQNSKLEIFKDGSHRLEEDLEKLSSMSTEWFKEHLK